MDGGSLVPSVIIRAAQRFRTEQDGTTSWHHFSAGAHYDPDNVAWGALIGVDEHHVAPGAGFDWHAHRGVVIVSCVVAGALRHESGSVDRVVGPGELLRQDASSGITHRETNASDTELVLVQVTTLDDADVSVVTSAVVLAGRWFVLVTSGTWRVGDAELVAGDSVRGDGAIDVRGAGEVVVVERL